MSKCQMNKYKAGGRCGGDSRGSQGRGQASEFSSSDASTALSRLIAAREAQDNCVKGAACVAPASSSSSQLALQQKPVQDKKSCIDIIMAGDIYE
jgi:hypothetical protein